MNDEQINAAIHAALGNPIGCPRCSDPECAYNSGINYCTDLNAMHEAEKTVFGSSNMLVDFMEHLCDATGAVNTSMVDAMVIIIQATAKQRAEAFLKTVGKWEEGE
jgi:hypothetical protein